MSNISNILDRLRSAIRYPSYPSTERSVSEQRCPQCGSNVILDRERGEIICPRCGLVVEQHFVENMRPEYRIFDPLHFFLRSHYEYYSDVMFTISADQSLTQKIIRTLHRHEYMQLLLVRKCLMYCEMLNLPRHVSEYAVRLSLSTYRACRRVSVEKTSSTALILASIYVACYVHSLFEHVRKVRDIIANLPRRTRRRTFRYIHVVASVNNIDLVRYREKIVISEAIEIARRFLNYVKDIDPTVMNRVTPRKFFSTVRKLCTAATHVASSSSSRTIATACVYIAADIYNMPLDAKKLYRICGGAAPTLTLRLVKTLLKKLDISVHIS